MVRNRGDRGDRRTSDNSVPSSSAASTWRSDSATLPAQRSSLSLHNVIQLCPADEMRVETSVIAVPGFGTPKVDEWGMETQLSGASVNFASSLHMYTHEPVYNAESSFTWESFLEAGTDLAEDLAKFSEENPHRPIIFIAHSLGGLLLKKALILAHQNLQDPRFQLVVRCLSGILFLGTPHAGPTDKDTVICHNKVLYACAKVALHKPQLKDPDIFRLATLATSFQQITQVPILSVYECANKPKLAPFKKAWWPNRSQPLINEKLATISSVSEKLLGVHLSHQELCKVAMLEDHTYSAKAFLRSIFEHIASNEMWTTQTDSASSVVSPPVQPRNPLNPLNLAPIAPIMPDTDGPSGERALPHRPAGRPAPSTSSLPRPRRRASIISTNSNRLVESRKAQLPCFNLAHHTPNPDFVGREEAFHLMDKCLLPRDIPELGSPQSTQSFALCGMGGVGKTSLAVEYAFSRATEFGAVFWIEAGGVSQLATDFARLSTRLGLETVEEAIDLESSKEIAKAWLNKPKSHGPRAASDSENDSWLLIFDNADNLDIITDYIPFDGNGSVLITSRDPFAKEHFFSSGGGIDMEPLPITDAASLLCKLVTPKASPASTEEKDASIEVATWLDGLPLAMSQMAGFIRRRHLSIREFADLYSNDTRYSEIHDVTNPLQKQRYGHTLATAYRFEDFGPEATRLLELLAFLNPDRVREDIFCNTGTPRAVPKSGDHDWAAATFEKARFDLLTSSAIKRNIEKKELWIHRIIQAEVRSRMDEMSRYEVFSKALHLLAAIWPPGDHCSQVTERWAICQDLLPHLERFYQLYIEYSDWEHYEVDPDLPMLMNEAAVYLHERGFSHEGKAYLRLAIDLCDRAQITQEPLVSDMHLTMGALANETNDAQTCLKHNVICLALRKVEAARTNTPDLRLAFAHSQMGIAYMMIKKFALATDYFRQSVELLDIIHADVDDYGFPVCNLGLAYWIQGELDAADKTLTDLLAQREAAFGKLDKVSYKTGRVLQALGNVRSSKAERMEEQGDHEGAKKLWDESFVIHTNCLKQYESTLGKFAHRTADACHKLAEHYIRRKEHVLAQDYLDRALSIWGNREWYKNESARSSFLRGTHLVSLKGKEYVEEGKQWLERAEVLRAEILPDEEPKELTTADYDDLVCFWSI